MWILESNGDWLQGKRMWLKPGKKYLFGRVKKDGVRFAIEGKTVSRKHFIITVDEVKDEDIGRVHARTKISITDTASKAGTTIDGELIKDGTKELTKPVTSIRPGSCPEELVISWIPCVLTFSLTKKEVKNGLLKSKQQKVKDLDIKAVNEYVSGQTTHVVAQKRNTPKGLSALIEGKSIVTEAYVDFLIYNTAPENLDQQESLCDLEIDFDRAWPDPAEYLPPPGKEPTDKPADAYKPDPARARVFDKHTFFFFDQSQYDTLLGPITMGHGKAQFIKTTVDTTTLEEGITFIRNRIGSSGKAIVVKLNEPDESKTWLADYVENLSSSLGQEAASQSDLLDTVLANNAPQLRKSVSKTASLAQTSSRPSKRSLEMSQANGRESDLRNASLNTTSTSRVTSRLSPSPLSSRSASVQAESYSAQPNLKQSQRSFAEDDDPRPRKRTRLDLSRKTTKGFDDDFDPDAIVAYEHVEEEASVPAPTWPRSQAGSHTQTQKEKVTIKEEARSTPKRQQALESVIEESDDDMDDLLPAAASMRRDERRREAEAKRTGQPIKSAISQPRVNGVISKPKKEVKVMDVRETVRKEKEAEEEANRRMRQEHDQLDAEEEGQTGPVDLVQVKIFTLPVRKRVDMNGYRGETWKPEWNGRKNFKGFRRARDVAVGAADASARPRNKIILPLIEYEGKSTSKRWQEFQEDQARVAKERSEAKQKKSSEQASKLSQRRTTIQIDNDSDEQADFSSGSVNNDHFNPEMARLQQEAEAVLDHPIDVDEPRQTRHTVTQSPKVKPTTAAKNSKGTKRPASSTPVSRSTHVKKKQKTMISFDDDTDSDKQQDDNDSDDMTFRFGAAKAAREAAARSQAGGRHNDDGNDPD